MEKTLYRNQHGKFIAGVASGLADYMDVEVTIVRLLFVFSVPFLAGTGLLVYIVLWIITPVNDDPAAKYKQFNDFYRKNDPTYNPSNPFENASTHNEYSKWNTPNADADFKSAVDPNGFGQQKNNNETSRTIGGLIILLIGVFLLLKYTFGIVPEWFSVWKIYKLWPLAIIAVGVSLIFRNQRKTEWEKFKKTTEEAQRTNPQNPVDVADIDNGKSDVTTPNP